MPLIQYSSEEWAQLSSAQKSSIRKRRQAALPDGDGEYKRPRRNPTGGHSCSRGRGRGRGAGPRSKEYRALAASVAALSQNVNVMAAHMSANSGEDDNAKPAASDKMGSNARNSALTKNLRNEKE